MRSLWMVSCLAASLCATASADVITLTPVRDNTLFQDADGSTSDGAGPALFAGTTGQGLARRALLLFDVASRVPAGARIDSVVLVLSVSNASNGIPRQFTLHRVLQDWGEGASVAAGGVGAAAEAGDATWVHTFFPAQTWSAPGGDFDGVASASLLVGDVGVYAWDGAAMAADVETWLARPGTNHGWLMQGEEPGLNTARRFDSREAVEPDKRPALTIYYTELTAARPVTWGGIKAHYR